MQRPLHTGRIAGNGPQIGTRRLVRLLRTLFPVAQRAKRDLIPRRGRASGWTVIGPPLSGDFSWFVTRTMGTHESALP